LGQSLESLQGELGYLVGQGGKLLRTIVLLGEKPPDNRLGLTMMQALTDNAHLTETDLLVRGPRSQEFMDDGTQTLFQGANDVGHQWVQSRGGFDHFPGHEFEAAGGHVFVKELEDDVVDKGAQTIGGGQGVELGAADGIFLQGPEVGVLQDGNVESFFVPEMVIYRGEVGPGPTADFPDGGLAEAPVGENLAGGLQEALPGFGGGGGWRVFGFQFLVLSF
jgi:hypothetical protein